MKLWPLAGTGLRYAATLVMDFCWSYPWVAWLSVIVAGKKYAAPVVDMSATLSLLAAGAALGFVLRRCSWPARGRGLLTAAVVTAAAAAVYFLEQPAEKPAVLMLLVSLFFLWKGLQRGLTALRHEAISATFGLGLASLAGLSLVVYGQSAGGPPALTALQATMGGYITLFFLASLPALAAGNSGLSGFSRHWFLALAGTVTFILAAAFLLLGMVSFEWWQVLPQGVHIVLNHIGRLVYYVLIPIGYLVEWAVRLTLSFGRIPRDGLPGEPSGERTMDLPLPDPALIIPEPAMAAIKHVVSVLLIVIALWLILRAVRKAAIRSSREANGEFHESLFSWQVLAQDILQLFRRMRRYGKYRGLRFDPRQVNLSAPFVSFRTIFRAMLILAGRRGLARRPQETPYEYGERLKKRYYEASAEITLVTEGYVCERYGNRCDETALIAANKHWPGLRRKLLQNSRN